MINDRDCALPVIRRIQGVLDHFVSRLDRSCQAEFEGVKSVLADYVLNELRDGNADQNLMTLMVDAISQEVDRLVQMRFPFTQEFCAQIAQGFEDLGEVYDDLRLRQSDPLVDASALLSYELAIAWYRVVKTTYTGFLPVQSQLRIVQSLIRLGALIRNREIFRRAIRELFLLVNEDHFVSLMTQESRFRITESEKEGLLVYRQRMRDSIRATMIEAVTQLHRSISAKTRAEYRELEKEIIAFRKGSGDLLHFLQTVTVIPELRNVEGGRDWLISRKPKTRYMDMREHVLEVERALAALEDCNYEYFRRKLVKEDRELTSAAAFQELFRDVFGSYHAFTRKSGISKVNFWISLLLHDMGKILFDGHHKGGALLVESLLESLGIAGVRKESITDYIHYHGQWKRFYFLENSPKEVLDYIDRIGRGNVPFMLLEKRRIESIVDLAATGEGHLTIDFIEESRNFSGIDSLSELARAFGQRRLTAWGLQGMKDLYVQEILPEERAQFFDRYLEQTRIVHYHNLLTVLPPQALLKFHFVCARLGAIGFGVKEVRLDSDKVDHLTALASALESTTLAELRRRLGEIRIPPHCTAQSAKANFVTAELLKNPGLLIEFKNQNETLSVNTTYFRKISSHE